MHQNHENNSPVSGNQEIVKSGASTESRLSNKSSLPDSTNDAKQIEPNDARYDPRIYQLKSERLEKTLTECEQEITFLVDLLKNKVPKSQQRDDNGTEPKR